MKEHDHLMGDACRELTCDDAFMTTIVSFVHKYLIGTLNTASVREISLSALSSTAQSPLAAHV